MQIALTPRSMLRGLVAWGLVAFFLVGGVVNIVPPESVTADYARWGFPDWFHHVTGMLELGAAFLLLRLSTRRAGALLAALVMAAALVTVLINGEYDHAVAPGVVLIALGLCLYLDEKALEARWEGKQF